jgi:hypothetical protein
MGVDAGESGDSFALSVFSVDDGGIGAPDWLCPECARGGMLTAAALYIEVPLSELMQLARTGQAPSCGACDATLHGYSATGLRLQGWRRREIVEGDEEDPTEVERLIRIGERSVKIPRVREELLVEIRPERAVRQGEKNRPVDFVAAENLLADLIAKIPIRATRVDRWQMTQMVQGLRDRTGADIDVWSFAAANQYERARLTKVMLHNGLLELLPNQEKRVREWKRLIRKGSRIDHPEGESKDLFDAESVAIALAVTSRLGSVEVLEWLSIA